MTPENKVIVVTGASSGIGLEIARRLVREGARVAFTARSIDKLEHEVAMATSRGGHALAVRMDVTSDASVNAAMQSIAEQLGPIDVVVNNAGNAGTMTLWEAMDTETMRNLFDVHVLGTERVMRAALPSMLERRSGTIVNFASTVAWVPMPGAAAYSAAKAAVVSLSEAVREELKDKGVDVRIFAPPHTSTESGKKMPLDLPKIFAPEWVAEEFVRALRGHRARVLPGGNGMLLFLQRLSPRSAARIMNGLGFRALAKVLAVGSSPTIRELPPRSAA